MSTQPLAVNNYIITNNTIIQNHFPNLCSLGPNCENGDCRDYHIFQKNSLMDICDKGDCNVRECKICYRVKYCNGKHNMIFKSLQIMKKYFDIDSSLFNLEMNTINLQHIEFSHLGDIGIEKISNYDMKLGAFPNIPNTCVQNFGAKNLGGGILGQGNVQEELKTLVSSLLPMFIYGKNNVPICLRNSLIDNPFIIKMNLFADTTTDMYATQGVLKSNDITFVENNLIPLNEPIPIYWLCSSVIKLPKPDGSSYKPEIIHNMFLTLYKTYYIAIRTVVEPEITFNLGAIGCGAFNHNIHVSFSICLLAISAAIRSADIDKKINIHYYAYSQELYNELSSKNGGIDYVNSIKNKSINQCITEIWNLITQNDDDKWRIKK